MNYILSAFAKLVAGGLTAAADGTGNGGSGGGSGTGTGNGGGGKGYVTDPPVEEFDGCGIA